jgi:putative restriction endonuclease
MTGCIQINNKYLEVIPSNLASNYWRNGVRPISQENYEFILSHISGANIKITGPDISNDQNDMFESLHEGRANKKYVTVYERNPVLRRQAIAIHGCRCAACNFDYEATYGDYGKGYIHIHHKKPVSELGSSTLIDPSTDLVPLCANCHAMVHRKKAETLSIDELKSLLMR